MDRRPSPTDGRPLSPSAEPRRDGRGGLVDAANLVGPPPPSLRDEHVADTRRALVAAARELFGAQGYESTGIPEILRRARVSRGALYFHFDAKIDLFRAVLEEVESDFIDRLVARGVPGTDIWEQVANGCQAFLDLALEPEIQRVVLLDGPVVLGWSEWKAVEERYGFGQLRRVVQAAIEEGALEPQPVGPLVYLLSGALNEAAMAIAHTDDRARMRAEVGTALSRLLEGLRQPLVAP